MNAILPDRETANRNGWTHQVQWIEDGKRCFVRCKSGHYADEWADKLKRNGEKPVVFDLRDLLQLH
jgi:hypothetical protein